MLDETSGKSVRALESDQPTGQMALPMLPRAMGVVINEVASARWCPEKYAWTSLA